MRVLGVKVSAALNGDSWYGYWSCNVIGKLVDSTTPRSNEYDAHKDALLDAQKYSRKNNLTFITEGYTI